MSTKKAPKKKAEPKIVKGWREEVLNPFEAIWADAQQPRVRIGSIVEYSDRSVMVVMFYDESEHERENEPDEEKWFKWGGPQLDGGLCELRENMWVSQHMIETGEAKIIGHFDIYSLVNGNDKR